MTAAQVELRADTAIRRATDELNKNIGNILGGIRKGFEHMSTKKDNDSAEGKIFRQTLHELVKEAREILDGPTKQCLDLCRHYK